MKKEVTPILHPIKTITLNQSKLLYKEPNLLSAIITDYHSGAKLSVIGDYNGFYLIEKDKTKGWIRQ